MPPARQLLQAVGERAADVEQRQRHQQRRSRARVRNISAMPQAWYTWLPWVSGTSCGSPVVPPVW